VTLTDITRPVLTVANVRTELPRLEDMLDRHRTLHVPLLANGISSASSGQGTDAHSGYQHAWIRDNVMVAYSRLVLGDMASALRTLTSIGSFLATQVPKMTDIIARPALKEEVRRRPAVRFHAVSLDEIGPWANAQNDALAYAMWLRLRLADAGAPLGDVERATYATLARYFGAIEYWSDRDSGAWEETRKVNASSVGAVVAALQTYAHPRGDHSGHGAPSSADLDAWIQRGREALEQRLPFEAPPEREADAAVLLLLEPLGLLSSRPREDAIISLVRERLLAPHGIRRYVGDSYFCQDYDVLVPPERRSADFSENLAERDALLIPGCEAQWCLFDPLLSVIYGRRFREDPDVAHLEAQLLHFNRAVAQLTVDYECPELYFLKNGTWVPNEHTPLAWTQANLALAVHALDASARELAS
jgi:phosphorylase kinase alpha/beta subunit